RNRSDFLTARCIEWGNLRWLPRFYQVGHTPAPAKYGFRLHNSSASGNKGKKVTLLMRDGISVSRE
ncbi:MAG TPA: hypothetical protein PKI05_16925, partial [Thermogutta sp.]|nr:hypothetical protein [Thermogutta sp.]